MKVAGFFLISLFSLYRLAPSEQFLASISGSVSIQGADTPIVGANITLVKTDGALADVKTAISDENGRFLIPNVSPGIYRAFAKNKGFLRSEFGQLHLNSPGIPIVVGTDSSIRIALKLARTAVLTGRVITEKGEPAQGFIVQTLNASYAEGVRTLRPIAEAETNDLGEYRIYDIFPGVYFLGVLPQRLARIEGDRLAIDTAALTNVRGGGTSYIPISTALRQGLIDIDTLSDTLYVPQYFPGTDNEQAAQEIEVRPGQTRSGLDFVLRGQVSGAKIAGRVVRDVTGDVVKEGASIQLLRSGPRSLGSTVRTTPLRVSGGAFQFSRVTPGSYVLEATAIINGDSWRGYTALTVSDRDDINEVKVVVSPGVRVTGRVTFEGRLSDQDTASAARLRIGLGFRPDLPIVSNAPAELDANGRFVFEGVIPAAYRLGLAIPDRSANFYIKSARLNSEDALNGFSLKQSQPNSLEIVVSNRAGVLDASVVDHSQRILPSATVVLVPETLRERYELYRMGTADELGRVEIRGISPGNYLAFAWEVSPEGNRWQDREFIRLLSSRAAKLQIFEGGPDNPTRARLVALEEQN